MLRKRVDADDDMRAPFFKLTADIADAALMKKLPRFRAEAVHRPVDVFHPMLLIPQYPVIDIYQFLGDMMRFFDRFDGPHGDRLALPKLIDTRPPTPAPPNGARPRYRMKG